MPFLSPDERRRAEQTAVRQYFEQCRVTPQSQADGYADEPAIRWTQLDRLFLKQTKISPE